MPERWDVTSEIRYLKGFGFFLQSQNNSPPATIRDPFGLKKKALALTMVYPLHRHSPFSLLWLWGKQAAMYFTIVLQHQCCLSEIDGNCR